MYIRGLPLSKHKKVDKQQHLILLNSQLLLGLAERVRSVESVSFDVFRLKSNLCIPTAAKEAGNKIADNRKSAQHSGKIWKVDFPIHIVIWLAVVKAWAAVACTNNEADIIKVTEYLNTVTTAKGGCKMVALDMPYFRCINMYDEDYSKIIVNVVSNQSATFEIWTKMLAWIGSDDIGGTRLQGRAPRNGKERSIAKLLDHFSEAPRQPRQQRRSKQKGYSDEEFDSLDGF